MSRVYRCVCVPFGIHIHKQYSHMHISYVYIHTCIHTHIWYIVCTCKHILKGSGQYFFLNKKLFISIFGRTHSGLALKKYYSKFKATHHSVLVRKERKLLWLPSDLECYKAYLLIPKPSFSGLADHSEISHHMPYSWNKNGALFRWPNMAHCDDGYYCSHNQS